MAIITDYPFPRWVRMSALGLAALVVFSAVWNWRFLQGHLEFKACLAALSQPDGFAKAEPLAYAAYAHVPESRDVAAMASYFRGVSALKSDNSKEAVALLQDAHDFFSEANEDYAEFLGTWLFLQQAKMSNAFDEKNYDLFLSLAVENGKRYPEKAYSQDSLASAYACQYAVIGNSDFRGESYRTQALQALEKYLTLVGGADVDFEQRIKHRLETREIITRLEFLKRFPTGWTKKEEVEQ
jgi:hypothetical protein